MSCDCDGPDCGPYDGDGEWDIRRPEDDEVDYNRLTKQKSAYQMPWGVRHPVLAFVLAWTLFLGGIYGTFCLRNYLLAQVPKSPTHDSVPHQ